jgi:polyhydroxyalkanoate synthesis regulator phasin
LYFGILATAIEESYSLVDRLRENSKTAEQAGRERLRIMADRRKEADQPVGKDASRRIESARSPMILPTRADIEALDAQITRLSQQIDEMTTKPA